MIAYKKNTSAATAQDTPQSDTGAASQGNTEVALDFLGRWPASPIVLTAIDPERHHPTKTHTFRGAEAARTWIAKHQGRFNLYFSINNLRGRTNKKSSKGDVKALVALHVDLDDKDFSDGRAGITAKLATLPADLQPSVVVDSGGGLQAFWPLREPVPINGNAAALERYSRALAELLGGDHCWNIDRIMRLPGTVNLPDAKKRAASRVPVVARLVQFDAERLYDLTQFDALLSAEPNQPVVAAHPTKIVVDFDVLPVVDVDALPVKDNSKALIRTGTDPERDAPFHSRSEAVFAVACALLRAGCADQLVAAVLLDPKLAISGHVREQKDPRRCVIRTIMNARVAVAGDFERTPGGKIIANSLPNIRRALALRGVVLKYDEFARRSLIEGFSDDLGQHLDDAAARREWFGIDEQHHFRPSKDFFIDVLLGEAERNRYHPVRDYLASLRWDGTKRLDSWLITYGGAEDTPFNRAVGPLTLIAAVRRVRQPGVKFDEMLVLESEQGLNKSSALVVLAVHEAWFTDSLPLNASDKTVIEHLSGRLIVEAAELKGMRRGDIEHLKAFLSRRIDRARMAYGRLVEEAPRQCVIIGTTNSARYLKDITGNRRFWPVRVKAFDLEALRHDRDQLWAEAAARETAGASIRLDSALYEAAALEQDERTADDPWVAVFEDALGEYDDAKILVRDCWTIVDVKTSQQHQEHNSRIGEVMRKLGWRHQRVRFPGQTRPVYAYVKGAGVNAIRAERDFTDGQSQLLVWLADHSKPKSERELRAESEERF